MKNRKFIVIAFAVLLMTAMMSLSACNRNQEPAVQPVQPVQAPTEAPAEIPTETPTEPAPSEPVWVAGKAKANYVEAVYDTLARGTEVSVTGKFAHYYVISAEPYDLLVDERCIRLETEDAFESYVAYSRYNRPVFDSVYMRNEPVTRLTTNVKLTVLEAKDNWALVEWADGKGYMKAEDISKSWIAPKSSSDSSESGGAGPADGTDVDVNFLSTTEHQNELMLLGSYYGPKMEEKAAKGIVIADNTEAYITVFGFGEDVKVVASDDQNCTIYLGDGVTVQIPRYLVRLEDDPIDEIFTGFSASGAVVFKDYQGRTEHTQLKFNNEVQVLYKLPALGYEGEEIYVVVVDGETMYMHVRTISQTKRMASSGKSSAESDAPVDVWTPPML